MENFRQISPRDIPDNFFTRIGQDWMLVCAGPPQNCNVMTASWGQVGFLWNKPVATVYVRPQRYTYTFMEREDYFATCFFAPGQHRNELDLLGTKSGRDGDKLAEAGLQAVAFAAAAGAEVAGILQAQLVLVCRKLYRQDLAADAFTDARSLAANYPQKDFHRMYVGEVDTVYARQ